MGSGSLPPWLSLAAEPASAWCGSTARPSGRWVGAHEVERPVVSVLDLVAAVLAAKSERWRSEFGEQFGLPDRGEQRVGVGVVDRVVAPPGAFVLGT